MHTLFIGLFICVLFLPFTTPFLTGPVSTIFSYPRRQLTCWQQTDTLYNGTITYQHSTDYSTGFDYCFIEIVTFLVNNLTQTITYRSGISQWNMYRNIAINQCNFSTTMDIGYGSCTPYYYETASSIQLCVCSTNNCSTTYASCQASVNQALSSPPPLLPVLQPTLSNTTTCQDYYANYSATVNIIPPLYAGCSEFISLAGPDRVKCSTYTPNHTVICLVFNGPTIQSMYPMALIEGDYEVWMLEMITGGAYGSANSSYGIYQYQTSTSIALVAPSGSYYTFCLCTTNNCNVDFTTCTSGMNIPAYLLAYNGSNSTTASTGSTSTGATISSSSTTISTSSASGSIITTLQSSTTTSVTTSITTSSISADVKCNRLLLVATLTVIAIFVLLV